MDKLELLLNEAKPLYMKRKKNRRIAAGICSVMPCFAALFLSFNTSFHAQSPIYDIWADEIDTLEVGSVIEDLGLPVDEYGLLKVS